MALTFTTATKTAAKLRMALIGISGTGKTYSALRIAAGLGGTVALIDTEHGRASAYAHKFPFDTLELDRFHPEVYIEAIHAAEAAGYDVLIIDSLSHAWIGKDGALELVDRAARASRSQNTFTAWRDVTPLHNKLVETLSTARLHVIVTLRAKAKYDMEKDKDGKLVPRKIGMEPVQRDGLEYEFDLVGDLDAQHTYVVSKSTLDTIHPGDVVALPDEAFGQRILADVTQGSPAPQRKNASETPQNGRESTNAPRAAESPAPAPERDASAKTWHATAEQMGQVLRDAGFDHGRTTAWLKETYEVAGTRDLTVAHMQQVMAHVQDPPTEGGMPAPVRAYLRGETESKPLAPFQPDAAPEKETLL